MNEWGMRMFSVWNSTAKRTEKRLSELGLSFSFGPKEPKKPDHCYQAKVVNGIYFAFAKTERNLWVELKLKPIKNVPQEALYKKLKSHKASLEKQCGFPFVWDEQDRALSHKDEERGTYRILAYIKSYSGQLTPNLKDKCVEQMVAFVSAFNNLPN